MLLLSLILNNLPLTIQAVFLNPDHSGLRKKLSGKAFSKYPRDLVLPFPKSAWLSIKTDCLYLSKGWKMCV